MAARIETVFGAEHTFFANFPAESLMGAGGTQKLPKASQGSQVPAQRSQRAELHRLQGRLLTDPIRVWRKPTTSPSAFEDTQESKCLCESSHFLNVYSKLKKKKVVFKGSATDPQSAFCKKREHLTCPDVLVCSWGEHGMGVRTSSHCPQAL